MQLMIPEGAQVHIVIGHATPLALPPPAAPPATAPRSGRPLLKGAVVLLLVAGAFAGGRHLAARPDGLGAAEAALAMPQAAPVGGQSASLDAPNAVAAPPALAPSTPEPVIPPDLARQLQGPPTVIRPPGSPAAGAPPSANPFGLQVDKP